jgi:hypothetical protein
MLLTANSATPTAIELIEAESGTVSIALIAGAVFAFVIVIGILLASVIVSYKWRGNAGGAMMAFIMGFVGAVLTPSAANIICALTGISALTGTDRFMTLLLGFLLMALVTAGVDLGVRFYILFYMNKTGLGLHKGLSIAGGYAMGSVFRYLTLLFTHIISLIEINKGTFLTEELKEHPEVYNSRASFQNNAIVAPDTTYFNFGLQFIAVALLYVLLTMYMIRCWLEENRKQSAIIACAGMFAFEAARGTLGAVLTAKFVNETQELLILSVFYVISIAVMGWLLYKVLKDYPQGREKFIKSMSQRAAETANRQRRSTWNQINEYNAKVDSEENADPDADDSEGEILNFSEDAGSGTGDETQVSGDLEEEGAVDDDQSQEGSV